ncbi:hypothetical protein BJV74DRAFT_465604 [Russula compacta]|nr:hypothetical protein BJV74DRAFT_465604 [Russula compacta]
MGQPQTLSQSSSESWMPSRVWHLRPDVCGFLDADGLMQAYRILGAISDDQFQNAYLAPFSRGAGADGSSEEFIFDGEPRRHAGKLEVTHLAYISALDWHLSLYPLKEPSMNEIFFGYFACLAGPTVRRSNQSWPFDVIMKCETMDTEELRRYQPRSDLLVLKSNLPRLLVQVNSKPSKERPGDLVRMLLTGATVVRFANTFLDKFKAAKNFVLFAICISLFTVSEAK